MWNTNEIILHTFSSMHKDLAGWSPSRCASKQRMKLESSWERAFDVFPLTFLLVAQQVAAIDASYRKLIPVQDTIFVREKTWVRNFLFVLSLVISHIITYFQEPKTNRRCLLQHCFCLRKCKAQWFRIYVSGESKENQILLRQLPGFFFAWKSFCFHDDFQFSKPEMLFQKKSSLNGHSFMGCIGDIYCAAISMRSLMVLSKLNSITLSIRV